MIKIKYKGPRQADIIAKVRKTVDESLVRELQEVVIDQTIKPRIAAGLSPVKGKRFTKYKDKDSYPGKQKPNRPVNLYLTGELLKHYVAEFVSGVRVRLGIPTWADRSVKDKAEGNNIGTEHIPARRFIPVEGEEYTVGVMRKIKDVFARRLASILSNKRR